MRIGLFADPHYARADVLCGTRRPRLSLGKMTEAFRAFRAAGAERMICMGDLTDHCEGEGEARQCLAEILSLVRRTGIPFFLVPGNHDYLDFTGEALETALEHAMPPFTLDTETQRLIVLDANYRSDLRRFDRAGVEWTDSNLPPEQMSFLAEALASSERPCVVMLHETLDPMTEARHIVKNAAEIRSVLEASGRVRLVLQGHYHPGADHTVNGIRYLTLPAMCEGERNPYLILDL